MNIDYSKFVVKNKSLKASKVRLNGFLCETISVDVKGAFGQQQSKNSSGTYTCESDYLIDDFGLSVGGSSCCGGDDELHFWVYHVKLSYGGRPAKSSNLFVCDKWMRKHLPSVYSEMVGVVEPVKKMTLADTAAHYSSQVRLSTKMVEKTVIVSTSSTLGSGVDSLTKFIDGETDDPRWCAVDQEEVVFGTEERVILVPVVTKEAMTPDEGMKKVCDDAAAVVMAELYKALCPRHRDGRVLKTFDQWVADCREEKAKAELRDQAAAVYNQKVAVCCLVPRKEYEENPLLEI